MIYSCQHAILEDKNLCMLQMLTYGQQSWQPCVNCKYTSLKLTLLPHRAHRWAPLLVGGQACAPEGRCSSCPLPWQSTAWPLRMTLSVCRIAAGGTPAVFGLDRPDLAHHHTAEVAVNRPAKMSLANRRPVSTSLHSGLVGRSGRGVHLQTQIIHRSV